MVWTVFQLLTAHSGLCMPACSPSPMVTQCERWSSCSQPALVSVRLLAHLLLCILLIPPHSTHASFIASLEGLDEYPVMCLPCRSLDFITSPIILSCVHCFMSLFWEEFPRSGFGVCSKGTLGTVIPFKHFFEFWKSKEYIDQDSQNIKNANCKAFVKLFVFAEAKHDVISRNSTSEYIL